MNIETLHGLVGLTAAVGLAIVWAHVVTYFFDVWADRRYYPPESDLDVEAYARSFVDHLGKASDAQALTGFVEMVQGCGGLLHACSKPNDPVTLCGKLHADGHTDKNNEPVALVPFYREVVAIAPEISCPLCDAELGYVTT